MKKKMKKISGSWIFLMMMIGAYIYLYINQHNSFSLSFQFFTNIISELVPILFFVLILMTLSNYLITEDLVKKHLKESGIKRWFYMIIGGILCSGPSYMWYILLANLRKKGLSSGLITCFLYNRSIKIPLFPMMIIYFGIKYTIVLSLVIILASVVQGLIFEKIFDKKNIPII